jgi:CheY-like chemotaxis protein
MTTRKPLQHGGRTVSQARFEVKSASDGQSALAMFIESPVDMVVADWRMPVMSGSELCHRLRTLPGLADVAFILVSGEPSPPAFVRLCLHLKKS